MSRTPPATVVATRGHFAASHPPIFPAPLLVLLLQTWRRAFQERTDGSNCLRLLAGRCERHDERIGQQRLKRSIFEVVVLRLPPNWPRRQLDGMAHSALSWGVASAFSQPPVCTSANSRQFRLWSRFIVSGDTFAHTRAASVLQEASACMDSIASMSLTCETIAYFELPCNPCAQGQQVHGHQPQSPRGDPARAGTSARLRGRNPPCTQKNCAVLRCACCAVLSPSEIKTSKKNRSHTPITDLTRLIISHAI